ncbi:hypothetical protein [Cardinium endosymbiont of Nabis limbatus]|uniref:hypothetical protein n=1 Tax=Cardinium endosymbiont of Nabis limbatus TaxID=3066217 RepID=UPI003AF331CE
MKKTYTRYKTGLFISLLSLYTLSSCVHTGRTLSLDTYQAQRIKMGLSVQENESEKLCNVDWKKKLYWVGRGVLFVSLGIGIGVGATKLYFYAASADSDVMKETTNTTTGLTTVAPRLMRNSLVL